MSLIGGNLRMFGALPRAPLKGLFVKSPLRIPKNFNYFSEVFASLFSKSDPSETSVFLKFPSIGRSPEAYPQLCSAKHPRDTPTFRCAEAEAHPRKVFFAPFHAIGVNMRLSFIKESAKHGYAGYYILLRRSRRLYAELKINNKNSAAAETTEKTAETDSSRIKLLSG
ncbi:MAG: hypothetical protein HFE30_04440 [Clostridiales bacterium]|nr:hypothetical protein [Clostridiales bacterium]